MKSDPIWTIFLFDKTRFEEQTIAFLMQVDYLGNNFVPRL